jgi:hypothetical protein
MTRASTEGRIRAAGERLLAGTPLHTDGALTVQNLIREAGVGNGTIYRSPYLQEFKRAVDRHATNAPTIQALTDQLATHRRDAKATSDRHQALIRELRAQRDDLRQLIQVLALERDQLLTAQHTATVTALETHRHPPPDRSGHVT